MSTIQFMLIDASLNDLVQERAQALGLTTETRVLGQDGLTALIVSADDQNPGLSMLMLEFGNDLAVI